jgi:hypothetical protein
MESGNQLPRRKQRGINRNIYNRPKGRGIKPLSASGGLKGQTPEIEICEMVSTALASVNKGSGVSARYNPRVSWPDQFT